MARKYELFCFDSKKTTDNLIGWLRHYAENNFNVLLADERRCMPPSVILELGNHGVMGLQVPKKYSGLQLSYHDYYRILMQLGAIDPSLATLVTLHNENGIGPILNYAKPRLLQEFVPLLARGRILSAMGFTEPSFGTNIRAIKTEAIREHDAWHINGVKRWNSSGWAHAINIYANSRSAETGQKGITGFLVTRDMNGVEIGPESLTMGFKSIIQNSLILNNVSLSDEYILGNPFEGISIVDETLFYARIAASHALLGNMKRAMQLGQRYLERRDSPIGKLHDYPIIRLRLNYMLALMYALEKFLEQLTNLITHGEHIPPVIPMVLKAFASDMAIRITELNMKLVGGRGYMETNHLARMLRDAYASYYGEGTNDSLFYLIGQSLLYDKQFFEFIETHYHTDKDLQEFRKIIYTFTKQNSDSDNQTMAHLFCNKLAKPAFYIILNLSLKKLHVQHSSEHYQESIAELLRKSLLDLKNDGIKKIKIPAYKNIQAEINQFQASIGDIDFLMAGEESKVDGMLTHAQDAPEYKGENDNPEIAKNNKGININSTINVHQLTDEELINFIRQRIAKTLSIEAEKIEPTVSLLSYGLDSLTFFNLSFELEEQFNINFSEEPFPMDVSIVQLVAIIKERIREK